MEPLESFSHNSAALMGEIPAVCRECDLYLLFGYPWMPSELRPYHLQNVSFTDSDRNASQTFSNIFRRFAMTQSVHIGVLAISSFTFLVASQRYSAFLAVEFTAHKKDYFSSSL